MNKNFDKLLFPLFNYLRVNDVPLGVSEYLLGVRLLTEGFILDNDHFKRTFRLLWAKSVEDQKLFDTGFAKYIEPQLPSKFDTEPEPIDYKEPTETNPSDLQTTSTTPEIKPNAEIEEREKNKIIHKNTPKKVQPLVSSIPSIAHCSDEQLFERPRDPYQLTNHLHLSQREIVSAWKQLRQLKVEGVEEDLNIEVTLKEIGRSGFFHKPILKARRRNQLKLLVLIDQKGSMAPFSLIINQLINSLGFSGSLEKIKFYYFHDVPSYFLYKNSKLTLHVKTKEVLENYAKENRVLIVSDAGAARGYHDEERLEATKFFLDNLNNFTYLYAWLNPLPSQRWNFNTAEGISAIAPMFSLTREGLYDVVNILRGQPANILLEQPFSLGANV